MASYNCALRILAHVSSPFEKLSDARPTIRRRRRSVACPSATVEETIETAGRALSPPIPTVVERSVIRDAEEEKQDWVRITTEFMQL
jgi:hypothetical protein